MANGRRHPPPTSNDFSGEQKKIRPAKKIVSNVTKLIFNASKLKPRGEG
jgi:hypothetical protein